MPTIKDWLTQYPTDLDTTTQMPSLNTGQDLTRVSQIQACRDAIIALQTVVGSDQLEPGSIRGSSGASAVPNTYLATTNPAGVVASPKWLYQFDGTAGQFADRVGTAPTLVASLGTPRNIKIIDGLVGTTPGTGTGSLRKSPFPTVTNAAVGAIGVMTLEFVVAPGYHNSIGDMFVVECETSGGGIGKRNYRVNFADSGNSRYVRFEQESDLGGNTQINTDIPVLPGSPFHMAFTRDALGNLSVYVIGVLSGSFSGLPILTDTGDNVFQIGGGFRGLLSSIRLTEEEFTAAQVALAYDQVRGL